MPRPTLPCLSLLLLAACASGAPRAPVSGPVPDEGQALGDLFEVRSAYQSVGRLAGEEPLPFVGSVSFLAGPGDSLLARIAVAFAPRALSFRRDAGQILARYTVDVAARPTAGGPPLTTTREEGVRLTSYDEAQRTDPTLLYQQTLRLTPGTWKISVALRDRGSPRQSRAEADFKAPPLPAGSFSALVPAQSIRPRADVSEPIGSVLDARGLAAYGGDSILGFVEAYRLPGPRTVPLELRDGQDRVIRSDSLRFAGGRAVETATVKLSPDSVPLGKVRILVGSGPDQRETALLVSFSSQWVVTNYDQIVGLLRYFGQEDRLAALASAPPADRPRLWREFFSVTDPSPGTPQNEAMDLYFQRLAEANARFRGEGVPGWRTDRGEVYITLGEPDEVFGSDVARDNLIRWRYNALGLVVFFQSDNGFGRYRLISRADFERVKKEIRAGTSGAP